MSYGRAGAVSIIDLEIAVSGRSGEGQRRHWRRAGFAPTAKGFIVADTASRQLCVMDASARIIVKLPLAVRPDNLCFNRDGGQLFITGEGQRCRCRDVPLLRAASSGDGSRRPRSRSDGGISHAPIPGESARQAT